MYGFTFYEEYADKLKGVSAGNVVAVSSTPQGRPKYNSAHTVNVEAALHKEPNSPTGGTYVSRNWLRVNCKRVSEEVARGIHPRLFVVLDEWARKNKERA